MESWDAIVWLYRYVAWLRVNGAESLADAAEAAPAAAVDDVRRWWFKFGSALPSVACVLEEARGVSRRSPPGRGGL